MDEKTAIELYSEVIVAFVEGHLRADEFEAKYLHARRAVADAGAYPSGAAGEILDDPSVTWMLTRILSRGIHTIWTPMAF